MTQRPTPEEARFASSIFFSIYLLDGFEVETRALLERWELDESLPIFPNFLLHEDEAPELKGPPILRKERLIERCALEGIQAEIYQNRPVYLDRAAEPAVRLVDEPIFKVADTTAPSRDHAARVWDAESGAARALRC